MDTPEPAEPDTLKMQHPTIPSEYSGRAGSPEMKNKIKDLRKKYLTMFDSKTYANHSRAKSDINFYSTSKL